MKNNIKISLGMKVLSGYKNVQCIYVIRNTNTNIVYVGSTDNLHHRLLSHRTKLNKGYHNSENMNNDYSIYGVNSFTVEILIEFNGVSKDVLLEYEKEVIRNCFGIYDMYNILKY